MILKLYFLFVIISLTGVKAEFSGYSDQEEFAEAVDVLVQYLGGINCMAETLQDLESAAKEFSYQINNFCKPIVATDLMTVISDAENLITVIDKFFDYNKRICKNADYNEDDDADTEPSTACSNNIKALMVGKYWKVYSKTRFYIKKSLRNSYKIKDVCRRMALVNFNMKINNFEELFDQCSQTI